MDRFKSIQTFAERAQGAKRQSDLADMIAETTEALGFDFHALGHHVDLQLPPETAILIVNYPQAWLDRIYERHYYVDDPILVLAQRSATAFKWADVPKMMDLTARQKSILVQAPKEGMGEGYTVPVHVPGEFSGSINFAVKTGRALPIESIPSAQYVGTLAFESARRLQLESLGMAPRKAASLSPRQRDCITLVGQGCTDKEIAVRLGIKPVTVKTHIEEAMAQLGTNRRPALVGRALFQGEISFSDIIK